MIMRRLLMSTVICSGLIFAAGGAQAATAQMFKPSTGWAVSHVAARSGNSGDYCALARRFSGDMILTFARNSRDESSLAIDFQQDLLIPSDTYYVTLKPGFGQDRMFEVKPVSGKAMVIRLGRDPAFHDALSRAGGLKVDISGQVYEFQMPDMAQGQTEMAGCLAALTQPAAGGDDIVPIAPPSSSAVSTPPARRIADDPVMRDARTERLLAAPAAVAPVAAPEPVAAPAPAPVAAPAPVVMRPDPAVVAEVESLREENMRLKNAMERERREFENRFQSQSGESSRAAELNEKIRLLEIENESLRSNLTAAASLPKPPPVTNEMMDRVRLLETENEGLRQSLAATAKQASAPAAPLQCDTGAQTAQMQGMNETLKNELAALRDENGRLKVQMADQTTRLNALEQQASSAMIKAESAVRADHGAIMTEMQGRIAQLEEENAILRTKVRTQHVDAPAGEGIITLTQLRSAEAQLQAVVNDRDRLAKQLDDIQKGKGGDLLAKAAGNWSLEEATRRFNEAEREIRRLGGQLEQERAKCAADVKRIEYMMFDPAIATKEQTAKLLQLEEQIMSFNANSEVQGAAYKSRIQSLERTVSQKDNELQKVQQRIAAVEGQLGAKDIEIREGQKKIVALEQSLATTGMGSKEAQQKLAALEGSLKAKDAEVKALQDNLAGLQQRYATLQQDVVSKDSRLKVTEEKLAAAQQATEALQARANQQVAQQQALTERQKSELAAAQAQLAELNRQRSELESARAEIANLSAQQAELAEARKQIAQLNAERTQLEQARAQLAQMTSEKAALRAEAARAGQLESDVAKLDLARADMAKLAQERDSLRQRVAALEGQVADRAAVQMAAVAPAAGTPAHEPIAAPQRIVPRTEEITAEPLAPRAPGNVAATAAPPAFAPAVAAAVDSTPRNLMDERMVGTILQQAGIRTQGGIKTVKTGPQLVAYSWDTGAMFGSAEQQPMGGMGQFDGLVQAYLDKTARRCGGEFGAIPGAVEDRDGARTATYEIACITPNGQGASAAMVFHARDGVFTAVAHETGMEGMDIAMDARDAIFNALMQMRVAAR